jgi:hypothetical protein
VADLEDIDGLFPVVDRMDDPVIALRDAITIEG